MPTTCLVLGCGSRRERDDVKFFVVPNIVDSKYFPDLTELSRTRRQRWIAALKRSDLTASKLSNQRVCSRHFISGKPSNLKDVDDKDWVPSLHMGFDSQDFVKCKSAIARQARGEKKRKTTHEQPPKSETQACSDDTNQQIDDKPQTLIATQTQTDLTMETLDNPVSFALKRIAALENKKETCPFGLTTNIGNSAKWIYYTGFDHDQVMSIFEKIESSCSSTSVTAMTPFKQLILTLIKLRLNLHLKDLAYRCNISPTTASTYFQKMVSLLCSKLRKLIVWPNGLETMPLCFKEAFQHRISVIVDCFEVVIEKPEKLQAQKQCWSDSKQQHTIKFLIGITPQGSICYISKAQGGQTSDKQLIEQSDFLELIKPGDIVLADRRFSIPECLAAKLVFPAFTKIKDQLHPIKIEASTQQLAQVRIHVEKVIRGTIIDLLRNKFRIFKEPMPMSMVKLSFEDICLLDEIVTVCSALVNISPPIVPLQ